MRTCYLTVDKAGKFLVTAGYHDGKMTILNINKDGSVGSIASEIFDHGTGTIGERNFRPHVTCVQFTPDEKFLCMVDTGLDNIKAVSYTHLDVYKRQAVNYPFHIHLSLANHRIDGIA